MFGTTILARRPISRAGARMGILATAVSVTALALAAPTVAHAAARTPVARVSTTGDLTFAGCIGDLTGCTATNPSGALDGAADVAVNPAGTDLYAVSDNGDAVSHFLIDSAGNLIFDGCIGNLTGCTPVTADALEGASAVAVTGTNLYVAADSGEDVSHFRIDSAGNLTFAGCIGNLTGCTPITANALNGASGLAVTPSGNDLYATSRIGNVVSHFRIDSAGNLIFAGCIGNLTGCTPITANALAGARGVVVSPNGKDLFAAASTGNVLDHFRIDSSGNLIFDGCIGNLTGCTPTVPRTALNGALGVAVNPFGTGLYATSLRGNVVSHFRIDSAGNLIFDGCIGNHRRCTHTTPQTALNGAYGVALTVSGADLYVSSAFTGVVSHFRTDSAGNLSFAGCIGNLTGCTPISPNALDAASGLAVTNDSGNLYAAAFLGNAVSHFTIAH